MVFVFLAVLFSLFAPLLAAAVTVIPGRRAASCTGTISSLNDVAAAVECSTVNINSFTVPAGQLFSLDLLDGTTVNLEGDVKFGNMSWAGPLFKISGKSITFNGNGYYLDGGGPFYWDGQGSNGGVRKPRPMITLEISGKFTNTKIVNSPAQALAIANPAPLVFKAVTIDNSQGNLPNSKSGGQAAGHNTDGFDISGSDVTIENCSVVNQDDCLAVSRGNNIAFQNNKCDGGHGISIGSIKQGVTVSGVVISGNIVTNSDQALRIKTVASASDATVENITFSANTGTGLRMFGVLIDQSYPDILSTPGSGVSITDVNFVGATNTLSVVSSATPVAVNCGSGTCSDWTWTALKTSGGKSNYLHNAPTIHGFP